MRSYKKCDKFIAYLDEESPVDGKAIFYIVDIETWNKKHCVRDTSDYNDEVYQKIEELGNDCSLEAENTFIVNKSLSNTEELEEFMKSLPWVKVVDFNETYVAPETIPSINDDEETSKKILEQAKSNVVNKVPAKKKLKVPEMEESDETFLVSAKKHSQSNPDKVFIDYTLLDSVKLKGDEFRSCHGGALNDMFQYVYGHQNVPYLMARKETDPWIDFMLKNDKIVLCLAKDDEMGLLIAFDDKQEMEDVLNTSKYFVKLKDMLERDDEIEIE